MYGVREKEKNRVRGGQLKIKHDEGWCTFLDKKYLFYSN